MEKILKDMQLQQDDKWFYDPHHIIYKRILENSYAPYIHEPWLDIEKLANGGKTRAQEKMDIETQHPIKKGLNRGSEEIIDLEGDTNQISKNPNFLEKEKEPEPLARSSSAAMGFQLKLGEVTCTPSSPVPK